MKVRWAEIPAAPTTLAVAFVFDLVRKAGYGVVSISPVIDHVVLRGADRVLTPPGLTDVEILLLTSTALAGTLATIDNACSPVTSETR